MDELHGIFTAYEMRIEQEKSSHKGSKHSKASKKTKKKKKKSQNQIVVAVMIQRKMKKWKTS
jgi:hypothetical protein